MNGRASRKSKCDSDALGRVLLHGVAQRFEHVGLLLEALQCQHRLRANGGHLVVQACEQRGLDLIVQLLAAR